jgi:hypothetical protein
MIASDEKTDIIEILNQHARELIRELNATSIQITGHPSLVAVEFRKDGEPIAYRRWDEIRRKIEDN